MANINPRDIERRAKECTNIVFGNNKEPFNDNVMQYKPIEYKDFGYGGKTKKVEPKIEDINDTSIRFIVPNYEEFVKDDKTVRKYITDVRGFCASPNRVFSLTPNLDWNKEEKL